MRQSNAKQTIWSLSDCAAIRTIAICFFEHERRLHPDWKGEDVLKAFALPNSAILQELVASAGFHFRTGNDDGAQKVQTAGYGIALYGETPYGSNRAVSDGKSAVRRRITIKGQLSYRGHRYSIGAQYRGRMVAVRERKDELMITCKDRSPMCLTRYNKRKK